MFIIILSLIYAELTIVLAITNLQFERILGHLTNTFRGDIDELDDRASVIRVD